MLRSLQRCNKGSDMHNDLKLTLEYVDELGRLKLVDKLVKASDIGTQAPGHGRTPQWMFDAGTWPSHTTSHEDTVPA
nr:hypothetical protein CFP56_24749 [Quercus suber]